MHVTSSIVLVLTLLASSARAGTIYVDRGLVTGANDGTSWANAYRDADAVAKAILAASSGDEIWVAAGTYVPTSAADRTISHALKTGVAVYGGFTGTETAVGQRDWKKNATVLSGDIGILGDASDNSFHVLRPPSVGATAILDGFTVSDGRANNPAIWSDRRGGGILCLGGASPTVRNCRFVSNHADTYGGGGFSSSSNPRFEDCTFEANTAAAWGGGFGCTTSTPRWDRCAFIANTAPSGSALAGFESGTPTLLNTLVRDNVATGADGGAIITTGGFFASCTIVRNRSTVATTAGIVAVNVGNSLVGSILWDNTGPGGAQGVANQFTGILPSFQVIIENATPSAWVLNVDPQFADPANDDFRLTVGSPAIDAGNSQHTAAFPLDLDRRPRFVDDPSVTDTGIGTVPYVDIGAFEFQLPTVRSLCFGDGTGSPCPCGNDSPQSSGQGCLNSTGVGGVLGSTGSPRILTDSFVLQGSNMPATTSALYFQGTASLNAENGVVFGDGLRCAGGTVIRLGTKTNASGSSEYPVGSDASVSLRGSITAAGSVRTYQCWYRNVAAFCQVEAFNLTNGLSVTWEL